MNWTADHLLDVILRLRAHGGDFAELEVKRASGGVPQLAETLCAFGNMPNGGTIILGLDESADFAAVGVDDVAKVEQGIASQARLAVVPPVQVRFETAQVDGATLVIVDVAGLPLEDKPCRVGGKAYLRQADGDYVMSDQEVAQLIARRARPRFDNESVPRSSAADLDADLTSQFLTTARSSSRRLAQLPEGDILRRRGVLSVEGTDLTVAGLYALGAYPQQFAPSLSITAAVEPADRSTERTRDLVHLDGPLPELLEQAMEWVRRNTRGRISYAESGDALDMPEIPMIAVRELIANALVHRDLSPHTHSKRVEIRLKDDALIVSNPGGLWGVSKDQLGTPSGKSAVNEFLYDICKLTRTAGGSRVIEGEGGGIREVITSLRRAGMSPPSFIDTGITFVAVVPRHALLPAHDIEWVTRVARHHALTDLQRQILVSMRYGETWTNRRVRDEFGPIDSTEARGILQGLVASGLVVADGERRATSYRLASDVDPGVEEEIRPRVVVADSSSLAEEMLVVRQEVRGGERDPGAITKNGPALWDALSAVPLTKAELVASTGLRDNQVTYALRALVDAGLVVMDGGWGHRATSYRRAEGASHG